LSTPASLKAFNPTRTLAAELPLPVDDTGDRLGPEGTEINLEMIAARLSPFDLQSDENA
jgi:hypothetical protein